MYIGRKMIVVNMIKKKLFNWVMTILVITEKTRVFIELLSLLLIKSKALLTAHFKQKFCKIDLITSLKQ